MKLFTKKKKKKNFTFKGGMQDVICIFLEVAKSIRQYFNFFFAKKLQFSENKYLTLIKIIFSV